jgi:hypothetical protein
LERQRSGRRSPAHSRFTRCSPKEQKALYAAHAPEGLDDLSILGPVFVLKLKFEPEGYGRRLVGELWLYTANSMLLELSTKCAPSEAFQIAAETRAFLTEHGIDF